MPNSIRLAFALGQLDSTRIRKILIRTHPYLQELQLARRLAVTCLHRLSKLLTVDFSLVVILRLREKMPWPVEVETKQAKFVIKQ